MYDEGVVGAEVAWELRFYFWFDVGAIEDDIGSCAGCGLIFDLESLLYWIYYSIFYSDQLLLVLLVVFGGCLADKCAFVAFSELIVFFLEVG